MKEKAYEIAKIMVNISEKIVWPEVIKLANESQLKIPHPFKALVGNGTGTYYIEKLIGKEMFHTVTYGKDMVLNKFNKRDAKFWTTGYEIVEKGYARRLFTFKNLMAHTVLHEMAHLMQDLAGGLFHGSVHNAHFYYWLDILHHKCWKGVVKELTKQAKDKGVALRFRHGTNGGLDFKDVAANQKYLMEFDEEQYLVEVYKKNYKTVDVVILNGTKNLLSDEWRVYPYLLDKVS